MASPANPPRRGALRVEDRPLVAVVVVVEVAGRAGPPPHRRRRVARRSRGRGSRRWRTPGSSRGHRRSARRHRTSPDPGTTDPAAPTGHRRATSSPTGPAERGPVVAGQLADPRELRRPRLSGGLVVVPPEHHRATGCRRSAGCGRSRRRSCPAPPGHRPVHPHRAAHRGRGRGSRPTPPLGRSDCPNRPVRC
jgi:hypothetical protein